MTAAGVAALWFALVLAVAWCVRPHPVHRRPVRHRAADGWADTPDDSPALRPSGRHARHPGRAAKAATSVLIDLADQCSTLLGRATLLSVGIRPALPAAAGARTARRIGRVLVVGSALSVWSWTAAAAGAALAWWLPRVAARRRLERATAGMDAAVPELAELLVVAMGAGATPRRALEMAAAWGPPRLQPALARVLDGLRRGVRLDAALVELSAASPGLSQLADAVAGAIASGSPLIPTLSTVAAEARRVRRQRAQAAARRLPVLLLFPLTCCILPAFGLLTVGPALAAGLRTLGP